MVEDFPAIHVAQVLDDAMRHLVGAQPQQAPSSWVILDGLAMFCGAVLRKMAPKSLWPPDQRSAFIAKFCVDILQEIERADLLQSLINHYGGEKAHGRIETD